MGPSYNDSFGSSQEVIASGNNVSAPAPLSTNKKRRWPLIVIIALIIIAVGAGVLALVLSGSSNRVSKKDAEKLYELLGWVGYTTQCAQVVDNVDNLERTVKQYDGYIEECKNNTDETIQLMTKLSGLSSNSEYQNLYTALKNAVDENVVHGETLESDLAIYKIWNNWIRSLQNITYYQTAEDIDEQANPLIESNNETLAEYGASWAEKRKALVAAYLIKDDAPENFANEEQNYNSFISQHTPNLSEITTLGATIDTSEFEQTLMQYNNYVEENL